MVIVVTGGREWDNEPVVEAALREHAQAGDVLIHGDCRGLDKQAGKVAARLGLVVEAMPAEWKVHTGYPDTSQLCPTYDGADRARGICVFAGPRRNRQMLDKMPDVVLAFHSNLAESRGTKDCHDEAIRRGIPTYLYSDVT